ncbi:MAG: putative LPS assembly protein LptD, partial [Chitinophagaceae bacterium]
ALNSNVKTQSSFYDTASNIFRQLIDTFQWGAQHSIPIQLSLPAMGPLQVGPAISFEERWFSRQFIRQWNPQTRKVDTVINKGFYTSRQMSFGLNFSTALFGTLNFKGDGVKSIRHVMRPTLGLSYKPDLTGDQWYTVQVDTFGNKLPFSKFDNSIFGGFAPGRAGFISFTLDNNLEMKVRDKKDTTAGATKKVKLIDGFGLTTGYNLLADSFPLSDFQVYLRSNLFEKINFTAGATLSPYEENQFGRRLQSYVWSNGKLPRFMTGFISVNTSLKSKPKDAAKEKQKNDIRKNMPMDEMGRELAMTQSNPMEFTDFNIPWSLDIAYALNLSRLLRPDYSGFQTVLTQSLNLRGDFNLTEKWKIQGQTTFDFQTRKLQYFTTSIAREMHCWQLSINVTPVGFFRSFSIT